MEKLLADTFFSPISLPDVMTADITAPQAGYVKLYAKEGRLYQKDSTGQETLITNSTATNMAADTQLFIQDTQPVTTGKYLWIQTNYQTATGFTFWFEDGIA